MVCNFYQKNKFMEVSKEPLSTVLDINDLEDDMQHVNNPVVGLEPIVKKYLLIVHEYRQIENNFYFSDGHAEVEVRVISDEIIRVRLAPQGVFLEEFSYALSNTEHIITVFSCHENDDSYRVATNTVACVINKSNFILNK